MLVVECLFENMETVREMTVEQFEREVKGLCSISSLGFYENENKSLLVLMVDGELNKELVKFASFKSIERLVDVYKVDMTDLIDALIPDA